MVGDGDAGTISRLHSSLTIGRGRWWFVIVGGVFLPPKSYFVVYAVSFDSILQGDTVHSSERDQRRWKSDSGVIDKNNNKDPLGQAERERISIPVFK